MKIMAVDLGDARTGIACCDKGEMLASPVCTIAETNMRRCVNKVAELVKEHGAEMVVIGHPVGMDGTVGERAEKCQLFRDELAKRINCEINLWDERFSTAEAIGYLNTTNTRGKKRTAVIDTVAATLILDNYLSYRKNQLRKCSE